MSNVKGRPMYYNGLEDRTKEDLSHMLRLLYERYERNVRFKNPLIILETQKRIKEIKEHLLTR